MQAWKQGALVCPEYNYQYIQNLSIAESTRRKALVVFLVDMAIMHAMRRLV